MIITRYITREVLLTLLTITVVLVLILLCQQSVRYLNYAAVGKIPTNILLQLIGLEVPYLFALLLPLGLYLGVLFTYSRFYADNEMTVLHMCGFSQKKLMRVTFLIATGVAGLVLFLLLWVNPYVSAKRQKVMSSDEATLHLIQTLVPGRFQVSLDGQHVMYVEKLSRDHQRARNIFLAQERKAAKANEDNKWMLVLANEGYQIKDPETADQLFVTQEGYRYEGVPGQNDYKIIQFNKYWVRIPKTDVQLTQENEMLSVKQLWDAYHDPKCAAELQWRFSVAISAILLAMLAIPLSTVKPRQGRYLIYLPAVLAYIVYVNLLFIARHWVEQGFLSGVIGIWWVHGLVILFTASLIFYNARLRNG